MAPDIFELNRVYQHWVKGHNMKIRGGREAWIAGHWADNPPSAPPVPYIPAAVRDLEERGALGDLPYGQRTRTSEQVNRQWERSQEKMRRGDMSGMTADEYRNTMNKLWPRDRQFFPPEETQ